MRDDYQEKLVREDRNIELFNSKAMGIMKDIAGVEATRKNIDNQSKKLKEQLLELCEEYGIEKIDNEFVSIAKVAPSESKTIDLKTLEKSENKLYEDLLHDYPKITKRKGYVKITVKKGN